MAFKTSSKQKLSTSSAGFSTTIGVSTGGGTGPTITSVYITDSSYVNLDDNAVSTSGGYIKLIGTGFVTGCIAYVNGVALTTTFVSSTEICAVIPALANGTYSLMMFNSAGSGAIWASGLTASGFPTVTTTSYSNAGNVLNIQLLASGDGTLTYSLQGGSTLPSGLTLSSTGLISGTASDITSATVVNFTVLVNDTELQTSQQAITLSITFGDIYFKNTTLAIQADTTPYISDASSNALLLTATGSTKPVPFTPFQGNGYYSTYFSATANYLSTTNAAFNISATTSVWTIECWAYPTANITLFAIGAGTNFSNSMDLNYGRITTNKFNFQQGNGTSNPVSITSTNTYTLNNWYHIAVTRTSAGVITLYVNGVVAGTQTYNAAVVSAGTTAVINGLYDINGIGNAGGSGYISNLRFVVGTAVYTAAFTPDIAPLTAITNTSLLTCQSARFIDNSATPVTLTVGGTPKITQVTPFTLPSNTYGSGYFNGTTDYVTVPTSLNFGMGTGSYTIEAWVYPLASAGSILETAGGIQIGYQTTSQFGIAQRGIAWKLVGAIPTLNSWSHIAVVRSGTGTNQTAVYINGVATLGTDAVNYGTTTGTFTIANSNTGTANYWNGYVSNVRVLKGITVYTGNFTPPTAPLAIIQSAGTNISAVTGTQTNLLTLQTDLAVNNNNYIDDSGFNNFITLVGAPAQGTFSPFSPSGWSTYFTAAADYITTAPITMSATAFTVECWVNTTNKTAYAGICKNGAAADWTASDIFVLGLDSSGNSIYAYNGSGSISLNGTTSVTDGKWHHIAFVYDGTNYRLYIDGVQNAITSGVAMTQTARVHNIGADIRNSRPWVGYISNFRMVNGTALYTTTFTPSTIALTAVSGTVILTCQDNRYINKSLSTNTLTAAGAPKIQPFSPFVPSTSYDPVLHGGSVHSPTVSDYLSVSMGDTQAFGTGDFTVEMWAYTTAASQNLCMYATSTSSWAVLTYLSAFYWQENGVNIITAGTVPINGWTHYAVSRTASVLKMFINGTQVYSAANTYNYSNNTTARYIGTNGGTAGAYISNLVVTKGTGKYTANFTVPTIPTPRSPSTTFLLNSTGAAIIDASGRSNILTVGDAKISTINKKYGTGSVYFDGTGDYLSVPTTMLNGDFGTGDFTVEFWMNATAAGTYVAVVGTQSIAGNTTAGIWRITNRSNSVNGLYFNYTTGSAFTDLTFSTTSYNDGAWHHVAACRASGTLRMFVDGVSVGTPTTVSQSLTSGQKIYVGYNVHDIQYYTGYVDDLRITKGVARYTANFTPPTATFLVN